MDILRHGPDVEVIGPLELHKTSITRLDVARAVYPEFGTGSSAEPADLHTRLRTIDKSREPIMKRRGLLQSLLGIAALPLGQVGTHLRLSIR